MHRVTYYLILTLLLVAGRGLLAGDRTISVYLALADNDSHGIVPEPKAIGNGEDPENNLDWGIIETK